jgi:hypothetical protein
MGTEKSAREGNEKPVKIPVEGEGLYKPNPFKVG